MQPPSPDNLYGQGKDVLQSPYGEQSPDTELITRRMLESGEGGLPVAGRELILNLTSVEVGENGDITELTELVFKALAYKEGLLMGPRGKAYEFDPHDPNDRHKLATLHDQFLTSEGMGDRPQNAYIDMALEEALEGRIRRAEDYHNDPERKKARLRSKTQKGYHRLNQSLKIEGKPGYKDDDIEAMVDLDVREYEEMMVREYEAIGSIVDLLHHVKSRKEVDIAFLFRNRTCEDPKGAATLGNNTNHTPEGSHFSGLFFNSPESEGFGKGVNAVLEEIVKITLPEEVIQRLGMVPIPPDVRKQVHENPYANGFDSAVSFGTFLNHLLDVAGGRMDVVWNAWKFALTTELINDLAVYETNGTWMLGAPPLSNALMTYLAHLLEKRQVELNLRKGDDGEYYQKGVERFVWHAGPPMTWDKIPSLCEGYLRESKITFDHMAFEGEEMLPSIVQENIFYNLPELGDPDYDPRYDKLRQDLFDLVRGTKNSDGTPKVKSVKISLSDLWLYGRLSFADMKFPWYQTAQTDITQEPGEVPYGSYAGWLLKRQRAGDPDGSVWQNVKSPPSIQELGDPTFFDKRLRNWVKVLGPVPVDVAEMPPDKNFRAWWVASILNYHIPGNSRTKISVEDPLRDFRIKDPRQGLTLEGAGITSQGVSFGDVLDNALRCGFLREADKEWIYNYLDVKIYDV